MRAGLIYSGGPSGVREKFPFSPDAVTPGPPGACTERISPRSQNTPLGVFSPGARMFRALALPPTGRRDGGGNVGPPPRELSTDTEHK